MRYHFPGYRNYDHDDKSCKIGLIMMIIIICFNIFKYVDAFSLNVICFQICWLHNLCVIGWTLRKILNFVLNKIHLDNIISRTIFVSQISNPKMKKNNQNTLEKNQILLCTYSILPIPYLTFPICTFIYLFNLDILSLNPLYFIFYSFLSIFCQDKVWWINWVISLPILYLLSFKLF